MTTPYKHMSDYPKTVSADQVVFLLDLIGDIQALWLESRGGSVPRSEYVAWIGGVLNRNHAMGEPRMYGSLDEIHTAMHELSAWRAWCLITALQQIRSRLDAKRPREALTTPRPLVTAIWTSARRGGMDEELLREIVRDVTRGETDSTRRLRRAEAIEVLRRVGGETRIFEMTDGGSAGARPRLRETKRTVV